MDPTILNTVILYHVHQKYLNTFYLMSPILDVITPSYFNQSINMNQSINIRRAPAPSEAPSPIKPGTHSLNQSTNQYQPIPTNQSINNINQSINQDQSINQSFSDEPLLLPKPRPPPPGLPTLYGAPPIY